MNFQMSKKGLIFGTIMILIGASMVPHGIGIIADTQQDITVKQAMSIANMKLHQVEKSDSFTLGRMNNIVGDDTETPLCYLFHLKPQGFIVVTADMNLPPIIAYSLTDNSPVDAPESDEFIQMLKTLIQCHLDALPFLSEDLIVARQVLRDAYLQGDISFLIRT